MTAPAAQWQLDRLSTSARDAAEIASLGVGLSLSSWLTTLIGETCSAEGVAPPAEPPKILEFTREIRDRVPSTPRFQPALVPAIASMPPAVAPQPAATPMPSMAFSPTPMVVAPVSVYRPQKIPPATVHQPPHAAPMPPVASEPAAFTAPQVFAPPTPIAVPAVAAASEPLQADIVLLPVAAIIAANLGTRRGEDVPDALLADIAAHGVRQPVTVRRSASNPKQYEIICGHRRWRAAQRIGVAQIPAIVVTQDDDAAILAALAENLQLNNLSVIDEAQAYLRLLTQCAVDASAVTAAIGRDRKHIVRSMRLLGLPPLVRHLIGAGMLSREHAFVLLDAPQSEALADAILADHLSVEAARQQIAAGAEGKA
jgi:ParB/RepB/Spo0J family partition protein